MATKKSVKKKKELTPAQIEQAQLFTQRYAGRQQPPKFKVKKSSATGGMEVEMDSDSIDGQGAMLAATQNLSGMIDPDNGFAMIIQAANGNAIEDPDILKKSLNNAAALMLEMQPQDPFEGQLIAQMVATHNQAMDCIPCIPENCNDVNRVKY